MSASRTPEWARRLAQRERDQEASLRANSSAAAEADEVENAAGVLPWGGLRAALPPAVPSLTALALSTLAAHPELITDLSLTGPPHHPPVVFRPAMRAPPRLPAW